MGPTAQAHGPIPHARPAALHDGWPETLSRRSFLLLLGTLSASGLVACGESSPAATAYSAATLTAFADQLIPADTFGPSASGLGVDIALRQMAAADADFHGLLVVGFRWLDAQTPSGFVALAHEAREALLTDMSTQPAGSLPRGLFDMLRYRCFAAYYGNPLAWQGLAIHRPPQPDGYPDYAA